MIQHLLTGIFILFQFTLNAQSLKEAEKSWKGTWKTIMNGKTVYERWSTSIEGVLNGDSWKIQPNGDSVYFEKLRLYMKDDTLCYEPCIPGEHTDGIAFKLIRSSPGQWLFYHPTNEFPRFIRYTIKDSHHLEAVIYNDENELITFNYERVSD